MKRKAPHQEIGVGFGSCRARARGGAARVFTPVGARASSVCSPRGRPVPPGVPRRCPVIAPWLFLWTFAVLICCPVVAAGGCHSSLASFNGPGLEAEEDESPAESEAPPPPSVI